MTSRTTLRTVVLLSSFLLIALSAMSVVPPWSMSLLAPAVAARELAPVVLLLDLVAAFAAFRALRARRTLRLAISALLIAGAVAEERPIAEVSSVVRKADAQLRALPSVARVPTSNVRAQQALSVTEAMRPLPGGDVREQHRISYTASDGAPLAMQLFRAARPGPRPTIVVIYGGAWRAGSATQAADASRGYAARGYTTIAIDYRHAPAHPYPAALDDVRRGLALARDSGTAWGVDTSRIALLGRSAGGHLAELAAYAPGGPRIAAVVAIYAPHDLVQGYRDVPSPDPIDARAVLRDFMHGTPDDSPARYREASPSSWVRRGAPPTLLLFGGSDHLVKPEFNRGAALSLHRARVPVVAVELPWAEHGFDMAPGGIGGRIAFNTTMAFLDRVLAPTR